MRIILAVLVVAVVAGCIRTTLTASLAARR
jgi:hypothetical protein